MAKEGKKLELYEILAAKRAKGKTPLALDQMPLAPDQKQPPEPEEEEPSEPPIRDMPQAERPEPSDRPDKVVIVDDELDESAADEGYRSYFPPPPERPAPSARGPARQAQRAGPAASPAPAAQAAPPPPEPRPRTPREVVLALDTAFIVFVIVVALAGSSYFLGYKRGQEERPTGLAGMGDLENVNADTLNLRHLDPAARALMVPPEQDYTLVLRTEPASEDMPERLEFELAEAMARGARQAGADVQGFIFRNTKGNDSRFVLAVGLGKTANDPELQKLLQIYNQMEGVSLSRRPRPYIGCQIAPVRELGILVE